MSDRFFRGILRHGVRHAATISFTAACAALVVVTAMLATQAGQSIIVPEPVPEADPVQVLETSWKDVDGVTHTVKTTRQSDETLDSWTARHQAAVAALQAIYPPAG